MPPPPYLLHFPCFEHTSNDQFAPTIADLRDCRPRPYVDRFPRLLIDQSRVPAETTNVKSADAQAVPDAAARRIDIRLKQSFFEVTFGFIDSSRRSH